MKDAVPICRSVEKHWVFEDAEYFKLWYCILSRTQYTEQPNNKVYQGVMYTQHRGEFLFGRREWSRRYGISEQRIRKFIDLLIADGMLVRSQLTRKFTIYSVTNYDKFNPRQSQLTTALCDDCEPTETPQKTHRQPTENPQTTTIKKVKKEKNVKNVYGSEKNVFLSDLEYERLKNEFPCADEAIEYLSGYIVEKAYVTKDHNKTIRRWVIDAVNKKQPAKQVDFGMFVEEV